MTAGELRTTYFGALGAHDHPADDDLVLGVVRRSPEWVAHTVDRNAPVLGPPPALFSAFKTVEASSKTDPNIDDPQRTAWTSVRFRERYLEHLDEAGPQEVIGRLREQIREDGRTVWLVCFEARETYCHRRLLAAVICGEEPAHHDDPEVYEPPGLTGSESDDTDEDRPAQAFLKEFAGDSL